MTSTLQPMAAYYGACLDRTLPDHVVEKAKHHIVDTVAAMVSGARLRPGRLGLELVRQQGGEKQASVIGGGLRTTAIQAAFANGMSAHADETDDSHAPSLMHPGCGIVPAALAMAEYRQLSGAQFIRAVTAGYDAGARMNFALGLHTLSRGVSNPASHVYGPNFGATTAAGIAAGVGPDRFNYLLAYGAQQASGITSWLRDTEHVEKAFDFGGMPARNGVWAATMVQLGYTAVENVIDGPEQNFMDAVASPGRWPGEYPDRSQLVDELGSRFEIVNSNIKKYCVGSPIQAAAHALEQMLHEHGIAADEIESISVQLPDDNMYVVDDREMPNINLQHLLAVLAVERELTFDNVHDPDRMADPSIAAVKQRVTLLPDDRFTGTRQAEVTVVLRSGASHQLHVENVPGTAGNPMGRDEVDAKARDLISMHLQENDVDQLLNALWDLENLDDMRDLSALLVK